jgi:hypothetical protein
MECESSLVLSGAEGLSLSWGESRLARQSDFLKRISRRDHY